MQNESAAKVGIVILNYNGLHETLLCLQSLANITYKNYEIIVVDNASHDGSVEYLNTQFPRLTILANTTNLGYAGGNNLGIRYALAQECDFVLLMNNDVIVDKNFLSRLVRTAMDYSAAGIVGPLMHFPVGKRINFAGGFIDKHSSLCHIRGYGEIDKGSFLKPEEVDYVSGACLLARSQVFKKAGLLDERYFLVWEETEFCFRARRKGFKVIFDPRALVIHKESVTFGQEGKPKYRYYHTRNRILFAYEVLDYKATQIFFMIAKNLFTSLQNLRRKGTRKTGAAELIALLHAIRGRFGKGPTYF